MHWMDFAVEDGAIAVNPAGQIEGRLELSNGLALTFVMAPDHTCNFGWAPAAPPFMATRTENEDEDNE